jgi:hypothetical protein
MKPNTFKRINTSNVRLEVLMAAYMKIIWEMMRNSCIDTILEDLGVSIYRVEG